MGHQLLASLVGQQAHLSVPRLFIRVCKGNYNHAAVLGQLVFWSNKTTRQDGWFYKSQNELATELELSRDQIARCIKFLAKTFPSAIKTQLKKANGAPTTHYLIDFNELISIAEKHIKEAHNPLSDSAQSNERNRTNLGLGDPAQSITDPNHIRSTDPKEILSDTSDAAPEAAPKSGTGKKSKAPKTTKYAEHADEIKTVIDHLNRVTDSKFTTCDANAGFISGRLSDGYSVDELLLVINQKNAEWGNNLKYCQYLRPKTLFAPSNFTGYLKQAKIAASGQFDAPPAPRNRFDDSDAYDHNDTSWAKDLGL